MGTLSVVPLLFLRFWISASISCLDDEGNEIDWFIGYKFPRSFRYAFISPGVQSWRNSSHNISTGGMLYKTYEAMYKLVNETSALFGLYNDEKSDSPTMSHYYWWGHMKGAFAFDKSGTGFWIIHSVPKLSEEKGRYVYPFTGFVYGQHFFCVSLNNSFLTSLVTQLAVSRPWIQDSYISPELAARYPQIPLLFRNVSLTVNISETEPFYSLHGSLTMRHFSKSSACHKDLYADVIAPYLRLGLNVESWQHGENEPSICNSGSPAVFNVQSVNFSLLDVHFLSSQDHAKWAVTLRTHSAPVNDMWVCLGDLNRQFSQFNRGGGTMCLQSSRIWEAFYSLIYSVEPCKVTPRIRSTCCFMD
ncbi:unnamed protein product [Dicrocoelium dendriticum]|nr:unnamed protein product [Dicrocoelium dendriticum]